MTAVEVAVAPLRLSDLTDVEAIERRAYRTPWSRSMFASELAKASSICLGVLHSTRNSAGLATSTATQRAREIATFSRFKLYKNSIPLGASSGLEVVME